MNADGKLDLATANFAGGIENVSVLLGNGDGTFQPKAGWSTGSSTSYFIAMRDLNADGKLDLVTSDYENTAGDASFAVLLGFGNGTFQPPLVHPLAFDVRSFAIGDLNADGKPDVVAPNPSFYELWVFLGNGDGTFQTSVRFGSGNYPKAVALGDVNGDGKLDLVTDEISVLIGNGNGSFQAPVRYQGGEGSVAIRDLNADAKPDLVVTTLGSSVSVLLGNGDGTFQSAVDHLVANGPTSVTVADFNADGKPDLATANSGPSSVSVLLATGSFTASANQPACAAWTTCGVGSYVTNSPSNTQDRACAGCPPSTCTLAANQTSCVPAPTCP